MSGADRTPPSPPKRPPSRATRNGGGTAKVRSGLAERKNPLAVLVRDLGGALIRVLFGDLLTTFLAVAAIVLLIVFFSLIGSIGPSTTGEQVPLSRVTHLARQRQLTTATLLDHDSVVNVVTISGARLNAPYLSSAASTQTLISQLEAGHATVSVDQQAGKGARQLVVQFLIPILLLVSLFALFARLGQGGGAGGIAAFSRIASGRSKRPKGDRQVTFADVAGVDESLAELREIRDYLAEPDKYLKLGAAAPKGVLLVGPPGTGKTLLAKAVAGEADAAFFSISGSDFVESLVGVGAARVRDLFRTARRAAPAIIFIDELDAAGRKRGAGIGQGNDEREQTLNQMLVEMDGFGGDAGLVVIGATNRPDILDPALLRPGRFDRQVTVDNPDVHGRLAILKLHGARRPLAPGASLEEIARQTPGFNGAELANVINEAALLSVRSGLQMIDQETLEEAIDRVISGPASHHVLTEGERALIAVHESSHAVVATSLSQTSAARKLSIVARGRSLGMAASAFSDRDQLIHQEPDLHRQLVSIVAGLAGERVAYGYLSTGVNDDLHLATSLARSMVTSFGMSEALGPVTIGEQAGEVFLGNSLQDLGSTGPATLELIDREVERLVGDAEAKAAAILQRNWVSVQETSGALLQHETLSGVALEAVLSTVEPMTLDELRDVRRPSARSESPWARDTP